jgi:hypothetical protein
MYTRVLTLDQGWGFTLNTFAAAPTKALRLKLTEFATSAFAITEQVAVSSTCRWRVLGAGRPEPASPPRLDVDGGDHVAGKGVEV